MRISDWSSDVCSSDLKDHSWLGSFGRIQFAAPRQAVDVDAQGVLAQAFFGARRLKHDGHHCRPPLQARRGAVDVARSEEHTSELQSLMRISYAVSCLKTKKHSNTIILL